MNIDWRSLDNDEIEDRVDWIFYHLAGNDFRFPASIDEKQRAWPEDCPLSEEEVRNELQDLMGKLKAIVARADELYKKLPESSWEEGAELAPLGLYTYLVGTSEYLCSNELKNIESVVKGALAMTPEQLRALWLQTSCPAHLEDRLPPELRKLGRNG